MNTIFTLNFMALAIFAWVSLVKIVPSCAASRYRYRLWRLRDGLADDIRGGGFESSNAARKIVSYIEVAIEDAADLTALHVLLFFWTNRVDVSLNDPLALRELGHRDRVRLEETLSEVENAFLAKAFLGSVSGWLLTLPLLPAVATAALRDSGRPKFLKNAASQIRNDLAASNQLDGPHEGLYQHVG
jgi:hypothetical protein